MKFIAYTILEIGPQFSNCRDYSKPKAMDRRKKEINVLRDVVLGTLPPSWASWVRDFNQPDIAREEQSQFLVKR